MARRRGVSAETPHISSFRWSCRRSWGGESILGHLDHPRNGLLVEAAADSIWVVQLRAGTPWSWSYSSWCLISFSSRRPREVLMLLCTSHRLLIVTEPPKVLGPPTVVLVQGTLDNPVDSHNHLTSSITVSSSLRPRALHPSHRYYVTSEERISGSKLQ
jgi:hypothetical protein